MAATDTIVSVVGLNQIYKMFVSRTSCIRRRTSTIILPTTIIMMQLVCIWIHLASDLDVSRGITSKVSRDNESGGKIPDRTRCAGCAKCEGSLFRVENVFARCWWKESAKLGIV